MSGRLYPKTSRSLYRYYGLWGVGICRSESLENSGYGRMEIGTPGHIWVLGNVFQSQVM